MARTLLAPRRMTPRVSSRRMAEPARTIGVGHIVRFALLLALKTCAWALVVAVPLLGVWAGSSLAVYADGPIWAAIVAGLCAFPLLPLAWEGFASLRRARKDKPSPRFLTFADR